MQCTRCHRRPARPDFKTCGACGKRGSGPGTVDGTAAAEHLERLAAAGVSRNQVWRLTGLHHTTVYRVARGQPCYAYTADTILAIPLPQDAAAVVAPRALVPALGSTRRLQALGALGWPMRDLAARMGCHTSHLCDLSRGEVPRVKASMARRIAKLYDRLSGTEGPNRRVRIINTRRGWAPPLAWECSCTVECSCNRLDDPAAEPTGVGLGTKRLGFAEAYADLRACGYTHPQIAQQLGITEKSLERQLSPSRYGGRQSA